MFPKPPAKQPKQRKPIQRTRIKKRRTKPRPGRVAKHEVPGLRDYIWERDRGICRGCREPCDPRDWHLAHIRGKRNWGDDPSNLCVKHAYCHLVIEHANGGAEKIVPAKDSKGFVSRGRT